MSVTFENEAALLDYYGDNGQVWLSVVANDGWPYILTSTEWGNVFVQGFPQGDEADEGEPESGTQWLHEKPEWWYPVKLVAPLPAGSESSPSSPTEPEPT